MGCRGGSCGGGGRVAVRDEVRFPSHVGRPDNYDWTARDKKLGSPGRRMGDPGGIVLACRFTLPHILVEGLPGWNVDAIVHESETAAEEFCDGLIGGSFLRQIIVEQHGDTLILRPRGERCRAFSTASRCLGR